jgi:hypothetical protein
MSLVFALDIITASFQNLNVFQQGASIPNAQANDAFLRLNRMLGGWALQQFTIPATVGETFPLVAGQGGPSNPYTIGIGGNFNTDRPSSPDYISGVGLKLGGTTPAVEIQRVLYTKDAYQAIAIKELQNALFTGLYYAPLKSGSLGNVNLWPVPNTSLNSLVLYHDSPLVSFADLSTTKYDLPLGYDEALIYNLERRLATPYGRAMPADDLLLANAGMRLIKRSNVGVLDMPNDFAYDRRGGYDINVGGPHNGGA